MARLVNKNPILPRPTVSAQPTPQQLAQYDANLTTALFTELSRIAQRLNVSVTNDGETSMTLPLVLMTYLKADLPDPTLWSGGLVCVSDETGGFTVAFSDGTNWRRVQDRAVVS